IVYDEVLKGGSRLTRNLCALLNRPYILISARKMPDPMVAAAAMLKFIEENKIAVLNVSGPRLTGWTAGYRFTFDVISAVIAADQCLLGGSASTTCTIGHQDCG